MSVPTLDQLAIAIVGEPHFLRFLDELAAEMEQLADNVHRMEEDTLADQGRTSQDFAHSSTDRERIARQDG